MKDRLTASALAGLIGALVQDVYDVIILSLKITDRVYTDFGKIIIMFKPYKGLEALIVGILAHFTICIIFGAAFGYISKLTSPRFYLLKGASFGAVVWFLLQGIGTLYDLPLFKDVPPRPALSMFIGAIIYGLVVAYTFRYFYKKTELL